MSKYRPKCQKCRRTELAKLSNRRVTEHGICVAVVFSVEKKGTASDAKNNKRTFSPEATAYEKALALVASGVWHLLFPHQRSLLLQQINVEGHGMPCPYISASPAPQR
jgi:hypothetical protein